MPIHKIPDNKNIPRSNTQRKINTQKSSLSSFSKASSRSETDLTEIDSVKGHTASYRDQNASDFRPMSGNVQQMAKSFLNQTDGASNRSRWSNRGSRPPSQKSTVRAVKNHPPVSGGWASNRQRSLSGYSSTSRQSNRPYSPSEDLTESVIQGKLDNYFADVHGGSRAGVDSESEDLGLSVQERRKKLEAQLNKPSKVKKSDTSITVTHQQRQQSINTSSIHPPPPPPVPNTASNNSTMISNKRHQNSSTLNSDGYANTKSTAQVSISQRMRQLQNSFKDDKIKRKNTSSSSSSSSSSKISESKKSIKEKAHTSSRYQESTNIKNASSGREMNNMGNVQSITNWQISSEEVSGLPRSGDRIAKWISDSSHHLDTVGLEYAAGGSAHVPAKEYSTGHVVLVRDRDREQLTSRKVIDSTFKPVQNDRDWISQTSKGDERSYRTEQTFQISQPEETSIFRRFGEKSNSLLQNEPKEEEELKTESWVVYHDPPKPSTSQERSYVSLSSGLLQQPSTSYNNNSYSLSGEYRSRLSSDNADTGYSTNYNYMSNGYQSTAREGGNNADDDHDSIRDEGRSYLHSANAPSLSSRLEKMRQASRANTPVSYSHLNYGGPPESNPFASTDDALQFLRKRRESMSSILASSYAASRNGDSETNDVEGLKVERGRLLISNSIDMTSGPTTLDLVEDEDLQSEKMVVMDNTNLFERNYRISRENPMYIGENDSEDRLGRNRPTV